MDICISASQSPRKGERQRTINNICLAFLCSDSKQGNIYDVSAFLLRSSHRREDIKVRVFVSFGFFIFCAPLFFPSTPSISIWVTVTKQKCVITPTSFACRFAHSLPPSRTHRCIQILTDVAPNAHTHTHL